MPFQPENRACRKLTDEQVRRAQMCARARAEAGTIAALARKHYVSISALWHALLSGKKGRRVTQQMIDHGREILEIRRTTPSAGQLAREFGVDKSVIQKAAKGLNYKWVRPVGGFHAERPSARGEASNN